MNVDAGPDEMQLVAMILSSMPAPPLPIVCGELLPDEVTTPSGEHRVANSHDLLGMLLLNAMVRKDAADDKRRSAAQKEALSELVENMGALKEGDSAGVYECFCSFTRKYVEAFTSKGNLYFMPLESVRREDRLHISMCHYISAQDIIYGPLPGDAPVPDDDDGALEVGAGGSARVEEIGDGDGDGTEDGNPGDSAAETNTAPTKRKVRSAKSYSEHPYQALLMRQFARVRQTKRVD